MKIPIIGDAISAVANGVTKIFTKKEERKKAIGVINAATKQVEKEGDVAITLKKEEWENISKRAEPDTWKDEYVTLIITSPLITILLGSFIAAFTGNTAMLEGTSTALSHFQALGLDMGELMWVTVLAALGIKAIK